MSDQKASVDEKLTGISEQIISSDKNIVLVYAFNGTGKTRLSVRYKDLTKANNGGKHAGVYYNAYSEDLFYWQNDAENTGDSIKIRSKNCRAGRIYQKGIFKLQNDSLTSRSGNGAHFGAGAGTGESRPLCNRRATEP